MDSDHSFDGVTVKLGSEVNDTLAEADTVKLLLAGNDKLTVVVSEVDAVNDGEIDELDERVLLPVVEAVLSSDKLRESDPDVLDVALTVVL